MNEDLPQSIQAVARYWKERAKRSCPTPNLVVSTLRRGKWEEVSLGELLQEEADDMYRGDDTVGQMLQSGLLRRGMTGLEVDSEVAQAMGGRFAEFDYS